MYIYICVSLWDVTLKSRLKNLKMHSFFHLYIHIQTNHVCFLSYLYILTLMHRALCHVIMHSSHKHLKMYFCIYSYISVYIQHIYLRIYVYSRGSTGCGVVPQGGCEADAYGSSVIWGGSDW